MRKADAAEEGLADAGISVDTREPECFEICLLEVGDDEVEKLGREGGESIALGAAVHGCRDGQ